MNVEDFARFLRERILEIDSTGASSSSTADEQQSILKNYFISREPQTTRNYPLNEYIGPVTIKKSGKMGRGLFVDRPVDSGQILLISNSEVACMNNYKLEEINRAVNVHANHVSVNQENDRTDKAAREDTNNSSCSGSTSKSDYIDELKLGTDHAKTRVDINGSPAPMFTFSSLPPSGSAPTSESSPQDPQPGSDLYRVPPAVMKQLADGLLLRASSLWKTMQILSLDHSNSLVSEDHIDMPIFHVHIYRDLPTANPERRKRRKGNQKVETDEYHSWMDMVRRPLNRTRDEKVAAMPAIFSIVARNASFDQVKSETRDEPRKVETCELWGVWLLPSFINHSCAPTCNRLRVGDALIIRAARSLQAGEEITLPYFDIFETLPLREKSARLWGFRCECTRCNFERSLGEPFEGIQRLLTSLKEDLDTVWEDEPNTAAKDILVKMQNQIRYINQALDQKYPLAVLPKEVKEKAVSNELSQVMAAVRKLYLDEGDHLDEKHYTQLNLVKEEGDHDTEVDLDKLIRNKVESSWIVASFTDAYLAGYALTCKPGDIQLHEFTYLSLIIQIIGDVHPGNMLGQQYGHFFFEAVKQLFELKRAGIEDERTKLSSLIRWTQKYILKFAAAYYGPQDQLLLLTLISD